MSTKHQTPYIAPEGVISAPESLLADIPAAPESPVAAPSDPLTPAQQQTIVYAKVILAYGSLFAACRKMIARARPANKLKHNYFVCAADLEGVALEMDGEIAQILDKSLAAKALAEPPAQQMKAMP